jgi:hypothetical protein
MAIPRSKPHLTTVADLAPVTLKTYFQVLTLGGKSATTIKAYYLGVERFTGLQVTLFNFLRSLTSLW